MKIVAINGSHRGGKGHTQFLIDRLFQGAAAAGAACECVCLAGHGKDPARLAAFPRLKASYEAYKQAGRELATGGRIRRRTQRRANREIIPVPLFGLLKRLPFRKLKRKFVENARAMQEALIEDSPRRERH